MNILCEKYRVIRDYVCTEYRKKIFRGNKKSARIFPYSVHVREYPGHENHIF